MAAVICCLVAGSLTANAVFRYSAQTGEISIRMASFSADYKVDFVKAEGAADTPSLMALDLDSTSDAASQSKEAGTSEADEDQEESVSLKEDEWYEFPAHGTASFTVIPIGTATEGYVIVTIITSEKEEMYCTGHFTEENTFSITGKEGTKVKLKAVWGIYNAEKDVNKEIITIKDGAIALITAEQLIELTATPTPEPTATVEAIASPSPIATAEPTIIPTVSPSASPSSSVIPSLTPVPTATVEPTSSPEATSTPSPSPEQMVEPTTVPSQSLETTVEPTMTPKLTEEPAMTLESTATPSPEPTEKQME